MNQIDRDAELRVPALHCSDTFRRDQPDIWRDAYDAAFASAMAGDKRVWDNNVRRDMDCDDALDDLHMAIGDALARPAVTRDELALIVLRYAGRLANEWAEDRADDAAVKADAAVDAAYERALAMNPEAV